MRGKGLTVALDGNAVDFGVVLRKTSVVLRGFENRILVVLLLLLVVELDVAFVEVVVLATVEEVVVGGGSLVVTFGSVCCRGSIVVNGLLGSVI